MFLNSLNLNVSSNFQNLRTNSDPANSKTFGQQTFHQSNNSCVRNILILLFSQLLVFQCKIKMVNVPHLEGKNLIYDDPK